MEKVIKSILIFILLGILTVVPGWMAGFMIGFMLFTNYLWKWFPKFGLILAIYPKMI